MTSALRNGAAALALAVGLAACSVGPDFVEPEVSTASSYTGGADEHLVLDRKFRADWWSLLQSPALDRMVGESIEGSWTLASVKARLSRAEQGILVAGGKLYPQVDAASDIARNHYGAGFLGPQAKQFPLFSAYGAGATVSYDLDLFGKTRRAVEQAAAATEEQRDETDAALLTLTGNVALQAVQAASLRAQIAVVERIVESDRKTLDLVHGGRSAGAATDIDLLTAQNQLDRDETLLPPLRQQLAVAQDALSTLAGKSPAEWSAPEFSLADFVLPQNLPLLVPSQLAHVRPDIRAAEARLHQASAAIGVAEANLYPDLTLSASIAEQGLTAGAAGPAWGILGGVTAPIFHGGELTARKKAAEAAYEESLADYRQTLVNAFGQVADTLHALGNDADDVAAQRKAWDSAKASLDLTRLGYGVGTASVLQVVDAQRAVAETELGTVRAEAQRLTDSIKLVLALGGGRLPTAAMPQ